MMSAGILIVVIPVSLLLWWVSDVCEVIEVVPVGCFSTIDIVGPVTNSVLLIECGFIGANVWNTFSIGVAHVENLAVEFLIGVESNGSSRTIEGESYVREFFPSLCL
jgi:hypothetical protein